jgi:hypothetical protein
MSQGKGFSSTLNVRSFFMFTLVLASLSIAISNSGQTKPFRVEETTIEDIHAPTNRGSLPVGN